MINFAPNNNVLLSLLTSNNPTTTAVAAQPQTSSTPQHTLGFPNGNTAASLLPSFSGTPANGSIFADLMNPAGTISPFTQQGQTPLAGMNPMPAATTPSGNDALGLGGLEQFLIGVNQYIASKPPSSAGASTAGGISPTLAPRQAVTAAPQGSPMIVLTAGDLAKLQGQNPSEATAADPETQVELNAKIEALTAKITEQEGLPKSTEALAKITSLENQLAELQKTKTPTGWQTRVETLEAQIRDLKAKATATTPKPTPRPVLAQGTKPTSKTT